MNKCLRNFWLLVFLYFVLSPSWAICEAEIMQANSLVREAYHVRASQYDGMINRSRKDLEETILNSQNGINRLGAYSDGNSRLGVARERINICFARAALAGKSASAGTGSASSNSASQNSNSPSSQLSQTSTPTGPMENCNALFTPERLKSLPGPQYVQEHIDCLNRNLVRSKTQTTSASTAFTPQDTQQQSQQAQQLAVQSYARADQALQSQSRADQARQGKRKTHDPAAEAHECIDVDTQTLYGGFKNKCSYAVSYGYCVDNPKKGAWTNSPLFSCAGLTGVTAVGGQDIRANGYDANHTKGGDSVYYFACKQPATAMDLTFIPGQGIQGRCGNFMGN